MTKHFTIELDDATAVHIEAMAAEVERTVEEEIQVRVDWTVGEERKPTPTGPAIGDDEPDPLADIDRAGPPTASPRSKTGRWRVGAEVPRGDPRMVAWERYKQTEDYANTRRWAAHADHVDGSLWAAFIEGFEAALTAYHSKTYTPAPGPAGASRPGSRSSG